MKRLLKTACAAAASLACAAMLTLPAAQTASAEQPSIYSLDLKFPGTSGELWTQTVKGLRGKKVAYVPLVTGYPLFDAWTYSIKRESAIYGIELIMQDANWNTDVMTQAITSAINKKVDVIIVHNPDVKVLVNQLKQAQEAGIYVIQVNMVSNYKTDVFVGADYSGIGAQAALDIVNECSPKNGKSGKVLVVQGATTAAATFDQYNGAKTIFKDHPEIKIVGDQSVGPLWSSDNAKQIVSSALVQHPDLCAVYGMWDGMDVGSAAAIQAAGKQGQVLLYTSGAGSKSICDLVSAGVVSHYYAYDAVRQGYDIMDTVKSLLLTKPPVGSQKYAIFSPVSDVTKDNVKPWSCFAEEMVTNKK
jgi:ABC-type sugar transport system substrate-binding protein